MNLEDEDGNAVFRSDKKIIKCGHGQYTGVLKWVYFEFSDFVKENHIQVKRNAIKEIIDF